METIFIGIAAYNEEDLLDTIGTAISKATHPDRVHIGAVLHYPKQDYPDLRQFSGVKTILIDEPIGLGVGATRKLAATLYDKEDFFLQIDSHTIFKTGWDVTLIQNYTLLKNVADKPIVSGYVPYYYRDRVTSEKFTMAKNTDWDGDYDAWTLVTKSNPIAIGMDNKDNYRHFAFGIEGIDSPAAKTPDFGSVGYEEQFLISGHFMFTSGAFLTDIEYDPKLPYHEENYLGLVAWTRGYRIFNVKGSVLWTREMYTMGRDEPGSWKETYSVKGADGISFKDKVVSGTLRNKDILTGKVLGRYGAPNLALLKEYESYSGIDYKQFYKDMYIMVEQTGDAYPAARALYDLERQRDEQQRN